MLYKISKENEEKEKKHKDRILTQVFGKEKKLQLEKQLNSKMTSDRLNKLARPKDRWKRGKILLQLKKKFPHDAVLERMIKEEFRENRVFKHPEEYDVFDDEEEVRIKDRDQKGGP